MSKLRLAALFVLIAALSSCNKRAETTAPQSVEAKSSPPSQTNDQPQFDACSLLTKEEIAAVEGSTVTATKNSGRSDAGLSFSQCFFTTAEFNRSVSLAVTQPDPRAKPKRNMREFWEETFGEGAEKKREERERGEREEEEHKVPPKKIEGIGEEALWVGSRVGGALYVLKKDALIRISVGGPDTEEKKIEKCKALTEKALARL